MKNIYLLILFQVSTLISVSQEMCKINCSIEGNPIFYQDSVRVCYQQDVYLFTAYSDTLNYFWEPTGQTSVIIEAHITGPVTYFLMVSNMEGSVVCMDSIRIDLWPTMQVAFLQQEPGCPEECQSQVTAYVSGGFPPYRIFWDAEVHPSDSAQAINLCSDYEYSIRILDTLCALDSAYLIESYPMPEIELICTPDTIFINDTVTFTFVNHSSNSIQLSSWTWKIGYDEFINQPTVTYVSHQLGVDTATLTFTTEFGCSDTISSVIQVHPTGVHEYHSPGICLYPNPITNASLLTYTLNRSEAVFIALYDLNGRQISTIVDEKQLPGSHEVSLGDKNLKPGIYFLKGFVGDEQATLKLIVPGR